MITLISLVGTLSSQTRMGIGRVTFSGRGWWGGYVLLMANIQSTRICHKDIMMGLRLAFICIGVGHNDGLKTTLHMYWCGTRKFHPMTRRIHQNSGSVEFARVSSHVVDFNARNKSLTAKLLQQGYRYHKLRKTFSKFYRRHYELVSKFDVGLKTLLHQGLSEPEFYGDLVYKFKKIVGRADFSDQFRKIIVHYKHIGYNINIMRQSACLVFNPITVNNFASLFNCTPVGRASDSMMAPT